MGRNRDSEKEVIERIEKRNDDFLRGRKPSADIKFTLEQHRFELHGPTYMWITVTEGMAEFLPLGLLYRFHQAALKQSYFCFFVINA